MKTGLRRTIAGSQIAGGMMLLLVVPASLAGGVVLHPWYVAVSLCLAAFSVHAGFLLAIGSARGVRWSRPLQALQVVYLHTASWGAGLHLGLRADFTVAGAGWEAAVGFRSQLDLSTVAPGMPRLVTINLFALIALISLLRMADPVRETAATDARVLPDGASSASSS